MTTTTDGLTAFGVLAERLRQEAGISWSEFAERAPISKCSLNRMRFGRYETEPRPRIVRAAAKWVGVSEDDLRRMIADADHSLPPKLERNLNNHIRTEQLRSTLPLSALGDAIEDKRLADGVNFWDVKLDGVSIATVDRVRRWPSSELRPRYIRAFALYLGVSEAEVVRLNATPGVNVELDITVDMSALRYPVRVMEGVKYGDIGHRQGGCSDCPVRDLCKEMLMENVDGIPYCESIISIDLGEQEESDDS